MREFEDLPDRYGANASADARGEPATDVPPPRNQAVPDAAARLAYTLEYHQRVDAEYAAHDATAKHRNAPGEQHPRAQAGDRHERAEQISREVELPASTRALPEAREILPNLHLVEVDRRKFSEYSLNPEHPQNNGKAEGWRALGYDVDSPQARNDAAQDLHEVIRDELLACGKSSRLATPSTAPPTESSAPSSGLTADTPRWLPAGSSKVSPITATRN